MNKIKIHEIAKKLGIASKEVLSKAQELAMDVKSHLSGVSEEEAKKLETELMKSGKTSTLKDSEDSKEKNKKQKEDKESKTGAKGPSNENDKEKNDTKSKLTNNKDKNKDKSKDKGKDKNKSTNQTKKQDKKADKKENTKSAPVIIRREVILADEAEENEKEEQRKQQERSEQVGFVEKNRKRDFNIVYRNKQAKPLTLEELFGFKKNKNKEKKESEKENSKIEESGKNPNNNDDNAQKSSANNIGNTGSTNNISASNSSENSLHDKANEGDSSNKLVAEENSLNRAKMDSNKGNNLKDEISENSLNVRENEANQNLMQNKLEDSRNIGNEENKSGRNQAEGKEEASSSKNINYERDNMISTNLKTTNNINKSESERSNRNNYSNNLNKNRQESGNREFQNRSFANNRNGQNNYNGRNREDFHNRNKSFDSNFRNQGNNQNRGFSGRNQEGQGQERRNSRFGNNSQEGRQGFNRGQNQQGRFDRNSSGNNQNRNFGGRNQRSMDERSLEKNLKNIMASSDVVEKESVREYNKTAEKQKNIRKDDKKKQNSRASRRFEDEEINEQKLQDLKQTNSLSSMFNDQNGGMLDYYDLSSGRGKKNRKKNLKAKTESKQKIFALTEITIPDSITVKDLATELKKTSSEVIKKLLGYGIMATINNNIDFDTAYLVALEFGVTAKKKEVVKDEDILFDDSEDKEEDLVPRAPVIVVMGHVDHGKTSLLDAIRSTNVIEGESGGITQHIGAYQVKVNGRDITFLDTPGHEAFTSMRARGAQITDIAILVVAADDGVMPQTVEAINHAKAAKIPIIVAVNKIDLPGANVERVKEELMKYELVPEEWGGDTIYVPISAKTHQNIDKLLEMVLLEADMLDLKVNPHKQAKGAVIEARLDKSKGPIASLLVQRGTLDVGDTIVVGAAIGRIRAMKDYKGRSVRSAGPSTPVSVMGLTEIPEAGETFYEVKNEKVAKHLIEKRKQEEREKALNNYNKVTLDNLFEQMEEGKLKQLSIILKGDVQGTVEALKQSLEKLSNDEVRVKVIHSAVGAVTESDVTLASVSNAIILAFNVRPVPTAKAEAEKDKVEIKQYSVIYQALEDIETAMKGMLDPKYVEKVIGTAEIRQTFKISNVGTIGGAMVTSGKLERNAGVRVIRDEVVIHDGKLASLKRFKDDAKEVSKGFECGLQIENYNDIKEGDTLEAYILEEVKR